MGCPFCVTPERVFFFTMGSWKERIGSNFITGNKKKKRPKILVSGKHCHEMTLAPRALSPRGEVRAEVYELNIDFLPRLLFRCQSEALWSAQLAPGTL